MFTVLVASCFVQFPIIALSSTERTEILFEDGLEEFENGHLKQ